MAGATEIVGLKWFISLETQKKERTRRKTEKNWLVFTAAIPTLSLILGRTVSAQAVEKKLKIGLIMPISGLISVVGRSTLSRAIEMAFSKVNETGGLQVGGDTHQPRSSSNNGGWSTIPSGHTASWTTDRQRRKPSREYPMDGWGLSHYHLLLIQV